MGRALKRLREQRGMTQDEAAAAYGVTRTAWQNYEGGRAIVLRTDMQAKLARALGATRNDLVAIVRELAGGLPHSSAGFADSAAIYAGPGRQQAVFPLDEGEVILSYPSALGAESRRQLSEYLAIFLNGLKDR